MSDRPATMTEPQEDSPKVTDLRTALRSGAFRVSQSLRGRTAREPGPGEGFDLQEANEVRLLLRGESVVDWHRLDYASEADSRRLLALNGLDWDDEQDRERIETLRNHAVEYLRNSLKLHVDDVVAHTATFVQLPLMASGRLGTRKQQKNACVLLKVMHILYHLDARELRTRLALSDSELFGSVEESVLEIFDQLRTVGAPVIEFQWSRKTQGSLVTKMLVKRETSAARVFDRLRFRLIVKNRKDIMPTLRIMLRKLIPFNYVVPGQTVNSLVEMGDLERVGPSRLATDEGRPADPNEFSGANYRMLNFIADLPVRVDELVDPSQIGRERGNVVFVLAEFQILDVETARANEEGESSHSAYKTRQHARVRERLLRGPPEHKSKPKAAVAEPAEVRDELLGRMLQVDEPTDR